jgi:hypothetical protein
MEIKKIADNILKKESSLNLNISDMIEKTLKLQQESGTVSSLKNLDKIMDAGFEIDRATLHFDKEQNKCRLHTEWSGESKDNYDIYFSHDFLGFNAGYGGEGPNGLAEFAKKIGADEWNRDKIMSLKSGTYTIHKN